MSQITLPHSMVQDTVENVKANGVHVDDNFNTLLDAVNAKVDADGSTLMQGNLNMNTHKITNLLAAENDGDAVNKGQMDAAVTAATPLGSTTNAGLVQIGSNISVNSGVISIPDASISQKGVVQLGRTNTIANAALKAVRTSIVTNTVPTTGEDGVIYFVYAI